jgi:hypothetical protein
MFITYRVILSGRQDCFRVKLNDRIEANGTRLIHTGPKAPGEKSKSLLVPPRYFPWFPHPGLYGVPYTAGFS